MHYKKPALVVQGTIALSLLFGGGYLAFYAPQKILNLGSLTYVFAFVLILLSVLPFGKQILGERSKRIPFLKYLGLLLAGQGALLIISLSAMLAFVANGPSMSEGLISLKQAQSVIKEHYLTQWGFFPWGLFGIWGLVISYIAYVKKGYPLVGNAARMLFENIFEPAVKAFNESMVFASTLLCLSFSLGAAIVLFSYFLESPLGLLSHLHIPFVTVTILACLYPVFLLIMRKKNRLKISKKMDLSTLLLSIAAIMMVLLIGSAYCGGWLLNSVLAQAMQLQGDCRQYFGSTHIAAHTRIAGLYWAWCLLWVPLAGSFVAKISEGRTVRELMVGVLSVPALLMVIGMLFPDLNLLALKPYFNHYSALIYCILSLSTLAILFKMTRGLKNNAFFFAGFMPLPEPLQTSRTDLRWAPKLSGMSKWMLAVVMGIMGALLLHTIGGWLVISFQFMTMALFLIIMCYVGMIGFIFELLPLTPILDLNERSE